MPATHLIFAAIFIALLLVSTAATARRANGGNGADRAIKVLHQRAALAAASDPTRMVLQFETMEYNYPNDFVPSALVSLSPSFSAESVATVLETATRCLDPSHCIHDVVVANLKPNTRYFYSLGSAKYGYYHAQIKSDRRPYSFVTGSQPGASAFSRIAILGDLGGLMTDQTDDPLAFMTSHSMDKYLANNDVHSVWHLGDIAYTDQLKGSEFTWGWGTWFRAVKPAMMRAPYMVLPGNHEWGCVNEPGVDTKYMLNFVAYNRLFRMPMMNSKNVTKPHNMWGSWSVGPVYVIMLSSETDYPGAPFFINSFGDQMGWLRTELAQVDRSKYPWLVIGLHRPVYSSNYQFSDPTKGGQPIKDSFILQKTFEQLFQQYKVDVVMTAHVHSYERTWPVFNTTQIERTADSQQFLEPKWPIYVVNGGAGNMEGLSPEHNMNKTPWSVMWFTKTPTWGVLETSEDAAAGVRRLLWTAVRSDDNSVIDTFTITKKK